MPQQLSFKLFASGLVVVWCTLTLAVPQTLNLGGLTTGAFILLIGFIAMQIIARFAQKGWMWPPYNQFPQFIYGDSICLPAAAVGFGAIASHYHRYGQWAGRSIWATVALLLGILAAITCRYFEHKQVAETEGIIGRHYLDYRQLWGPAKLWHDIVQLPVTVFFFVISMPLLWKVDWAWHGGWWAAVLVFGGLGSWLALGALASTRHFIWSHPAYDWKTRTTRHVLYRGR